jgi:hypothetical protein
MRLTELVGSSGSSANDREEIRFAKDSPLEGDGFEPSVPLHLGPGGKFQDCSRKPPSRRPCAQMGKARAGNQAPAAVRWVTVSRGGARKVW